MYTKLSTVTIINLLSQAPNCPVEYDFFVLLGNLAKSDVETSVASVVVWVRDQIEINAEQQRALINRFLTC